MSTSDFERTIVHGEAAVAHMKANRLPAYPMVYELWYTYSCGFNRELNSSINGVLKRNGRIAFNDAQRLYEEILSPARFGSRVEEVSDQISQEIGDVSTVLDDALSITGDYGESLEGASVSLSSAGDQKSVAQIVKKLVDSTHSMQDYTRNLEDRLVESRSQIVELQQTLEAIRFESLTDELTGIANRKHFDLALERSMEEAQISGEPLSLVLCDIDHFKAFNDKHGHQTGDQVLRLVGKTLKANIKGRDVAARYGGEEFAILLPETKLENAIKVADSIRLAIQTKDLIKRSTGENLGRVTLSAGVVTFRPTETGESLVHRADVCLYAAKGAGRNQVKSETDPDIKELSAVA